MYISINFLVFIAQLIFIVKNQTWARYTIFVCSVVLVGMDVMMSVKFYITVSRFVQLLSENVSKRKTCARIGIMWVYVILFILRSISENLIRGGSQLEYWITGCYFDMFVKFNEGDKWAHTLIEILTILQDWFPAIIGITILLLFITFSSESFDFVAGRPCCMDERETSTFL